MTKRKSITAEELMASLANEPEFLARQKRQESERQKRAAVWRRAEEPLVKELNAAGFDVASAWDFVNTSKSYLDALPILVKHLQRPYPDRVLEGIARALAVPQSKFAWDVLVRMYHKEEGEDTKDALALAIAAIADDSVIEEIVALALDETHGSSRIFLLHALERSADPGAKAALMTLGTDPELKEEIQVILGRLRLRKR